MYSFINYQIEFLTEDLMRQCTAECEEAIGRGDAQSHVDGTSQIARLANRVLMVAKQEADNSEDPAFIGRVTSAANVLQASTISNYILYFTKWNLKITLNDIFYLSNIRLETKSCRISYRKSMVKYDRT